MALSCDSSASPPRLPAHKVIVGSKKIYSYLQVINGELDTYFIWLASQLKQINRPFTFDLNHEPENQANGVGRPETFSDATWYSNRANTTVAYRQNVLKEYADANRHVALLFRSEGVSKCLFMNCFASVGSNGTDYNSWVYPALWPGDDVIDVCAWDPYDTGGNKTPYNTFALGYNLLKNGLLDSSPFYAGTGAKNKPFYLAEYGTNTIAGSTAYSTDWLSKVPAALQQFPQIKGVTYWSAGFSSSTGYVIHTAGSEERAAFVAASQNPYVTPMLAV
jgi:hypothetical protein